MVFGHIPATPVVGPPQIEAEVEAEQVLVPSRVDTPAVAANIDEEDLDFGVHLVAHDNDNDNIENEDEIHKKEEGDVGFGSPDVYDVQKLIEMCLEDPGTDVEHEAYDEVKQWKKDFNILVKIRIFFIVTHLSMFVLHIQISETFNAQKLNKDIGNMHKHTG